MAIPKKVMFACGAFIILAGGVTSLSLNRSHQSNDWTALMATSEPQAKTGADTVRKTTKQNDLKGTNNEQATTNKTSGNLAGQTMMVDIKGAVQHPGVYPVKEGSRVVEAIQLAGGFQKEADSDQINLSQHVTDEMVIFVPKKGEKPPNLLTVSPAVSQTGEQSTSSSSSEPSNPSSSNPIIHLNSCSLNDLENLPGIGPTKAKAIFDFREQNGPFASVDDLVNVTGIGEKTLEHIKSYLDLN